MYMKTILLFLVLFKVTSSSYGQAEASDVKTSDPVDVVKNFLSAYINGDHEKFASYIAPDVIWVQPGDNRIAGVKTSRTELLKMGAKMFELSAGTIKLSDIEYYSSNGNTVVCVLHWKAAQPTGNVLDIKNIDVYTVENSKIVMARIFSKDIRAEDDFWGR